MKDCIGRELKIGDYVTAVWANGNLALFQVLSQKGPAHITSNCEYYDLKLKRMFSAKNNNSNSKTTIKTSLQVTLVDTEYVIMYLLAK